MASNDGEGESLVEESLREDPSNEVGEELMVGRNTIEEETRDEVVIQDDREDPSNDDGEVLVEGEY